MNGPTRGASRSRPGQFRGRRDFRTGNLVSRNQSSFTKSGVRIRHSRGSGNPEAFDFPGFRVALAIASLPGMTIKLCNELLRHDTRVAGCKNSDCRLLKKIPEARRAKNRRGRGTACRAATNGWSEPIEHNEAYESFQQPASASYLTSEVSPPARCLACACVNEGYWDLDPKSPLLL
jgi:hypothetical protein